MHNVHHIGTLRELEIEQLRCGVGRRDFDRSCWRAGRDLTAVFEYTKIIVAEFQDIRLLDAKLESN